MAGVGVVLPEEELSAAVLWLLEPQPARMAAEMANASAAGLNKPLGAVRVFKFIIPLT